MASQAHCSAAQDNHDEMQAGTVNMDAYMEFVLNCGLIGREFTAKDARRIFVKVNIADELFVQVSPPAAPRAPAHPRSG